MNLDPYLGQFIKVNTREQEWFVGKLLSMRTHENGSNEFEFDIISTSKDGKIDHKELKEFRKKNKGIQMIQADGVAGIEELDPRIQEGIRLTLTNVPNILDAYHTLDVENLPQRIEFGKIEKPDDL